MDYQKHFAKIRLTEDMARSQAEAQEKLKLAQKYLDMANNLTKQAVDITAATAGQATAAGVDLPVDAAQIQQQGAETESLAGQVGYGIGKLLALTLMFFGGAVAANRLTDKPYPRGR